MLEYEEETICLTTDEMRVALIFQLHKSVRHHHPFLFLIAVIYKAVGHFFQSFWISTQILP